MSSPCARTAWAGLSACTLALLSACGTAAPAPRSLSLVGEPVRSVSARANEFEPGAQEHVALGIAPDGRLAVAWESRRQRGGRPGVYGRVLDPLGRAVTAEVALAGPDGPGFESHPAIACAGDHAIWAAWSAFGADGSGSGIVARRFDAALRPAGPALGVNQARDGDQSNVTLATRSDGSALVAWVNSGEHGRAAISARLYGPGGEPLGDELTLSDASSRNATPVVAAQGDGYLAVWARAGADGAPGPVVARRLDASGGFIGEEVILADRGIEPAIGVDATGRLGLAWMIPQGDDYAVMARAYAPDLAPAGPAVSVSQDAPGLRSGAAITLLDDGRAVILFNTLAVRENAQGKIEAANDLCRVDLDLVNAGPLALTYTPAPGEQSVTIASGAQRLARGPGGTLAYAWTGQGESPDRQSANVTIELPEAMAATLETRPMSDTGPAIASAPGGPDAAAEPHVPPVFDPNWKPQEPAIIAREDDADFGFEAVPGTGWAPPDPEMAVGLNHLVVIVNGQIAFFDKSGTNLFRAAIEGASGFWGPVGAGSFVFDPEALYDAATNRFMAMACERTGGQSYFLLAVSDDGNPVGTWHKYRFNVTALGGNDIDSPNFAFDATSITLTADFFTPDDFLVFTVDKAAALAGLPSPTTRSLLISGSHSYGVPTTNSPAPAQYLLQSFEATANTSVRLHAIRNPLTTPTRVTFDLAVPEYRFPTPPTQQGTSNRPTLFEPRFWSCSYRNGSIWAVHHITTAAVPSRTRVRWYQFAMNGWPASGSNPTLAQWGEIDAGGSNHAFFPSIDANDAGDAAITYARSGPTEFIGMWRAVRRHTDAPGAFRTQTLVRASTVPYTGAARWGDYSATRPDPANPCRFWGHHEWTTSSSAWRTWAASYDNFSTVDFNKDCQIDFADYLEFLNLYDAQSSLADLNGDGLVDFADYLEFLNLYELG